MPRVKENPCLHLGDVQMSINIKVAIFSTPRGVGREKGNFLVMTTSTYCETISGEHENKTMSYIISKNKIKQKCPICKRSKARTHTLHSGITEKLHPKAT